MDRYIAFDCETGGITEDTSFLTGYFVVMDSNFQPLDMLDLKVKPNNKAPYIITAEALAINGINLVEHDKVAITQSEAGGKLREFLWRHSENGKVKLIPVGHNVAFDETFIWAHLLNKKEYEKYCSYRKLDTAVVAQYLKAKGKIPNTVSGSLSSLMAHYGLSFQTRAHDADSDTIATVEVLKKMLAE